MMRSMPLDIGTLHFVGIGGIGMSGIAEVLHTLGYQVQGSDIAQGPNVSRLEGKGVRILRDHAPENIKDKEGHLPAAVVVSSAVRDDNPELVAARAEGIPVVRRAQMLAELMRLKWSIAVGGTHGKTTTTSMIGHMLETAQFDPTVINGGIVNAYGSNTRLGQSEWMVVEADESDGTFTRLPSCVAVITNIDPEHLEHYGSFANVRKAYQQFIKNLPFYGYAVLCLDHPEVQALIPSVSDRRIITYGFNPQADVRALNLSPVEGGSVFDVMFSSKITGGKEVVLKDVHLSMPGRHNAQNALASLAIAQEMEVKPPLMKKALSGFKGVKRRFTPVGKINDVSIIDDYAHHPVEIETVLKTAQSAVEEKGGRVVAVFQPHRYSRLQSLYEEFCTCFNDADTVIVADVYPGGEDPIESIDKQYLIEGIRRHGHRHILALPDKSELARMLSKIAGPGDVVVCMGAGDITVWAQDLPKQLENVFASARHSAA